MRRTVFVVFFIACVVAISFGNTLSYGFVWDDHFLIGDSYFVRHWSALPKIFTSHFWAGHADWMFTLEQLKQVYERLLATDITLKRSPLDEKLTLELLVLDIATRNLAPREEPAALEELAG